MDVLAAAEGRVTGDDDHGGPTSATNGAILEQSPLIARQQEEGNKFQKAIAVWRGGITLWHKQQQLLTCHRPLGVDLTNLVPRLDATASDIVSHQRDSLVQRKDLAQKTKDFRKLDDAGKLGEHKGLLKGTYDRGLVAECKADSPGESVSNIYRPLDESKQDILVFLPPALFLPL